MVRRPGVLRPMILWLLACGEVPTYHADIAPFVGASCLPCHASDGASGLPLDDVASVRAMGPAMSAAIEAGRMPAGNVDRGGTCGDFTGPAPVDPLDAQLLQEWLDDGAPEGPVVDLEQPAEVRFEADEAYAIGPLRDDGANRCVVIDGGDPGFLRALRVTGEPANAIHHAMLFTLRGPSDVAAARALDAADPEVGWSCASTPNVQGAVLAGVWTPGDPIVAFPAGTGVELPGGPMIVQLHLGADDARATLELETTDAVEHVLAYVPVAATNFALPPGEASVSWTETFPLAAPDLRVYGVMPHLHTRGRALSLRSPDRCLVDAPRWDYRWQELASYTTPVTVRSGTPLTLSCTFSTLDATTTTVWGERAEDEMCMVFLLASR